MPRATPLPRPTRKPVLADPARLDVATDSATADNVLERCCSDATGDGRSAHANRTLLRACKAAVEHDQYLQLKLIEAASRELPLGLDDARRDSSAPARTASSTKGTSEPERGLQVQERSEPRAGNRSRTDWTHRATRPHPHNKGTSWKSPKTRSSTCSESRASLTKSTRLNRNCPTRSIPSAIPACSRSSGSSRKTCSPSSVTVSPACRSRTPGSPSADELATQDTRVLSRYAATDRRGPALGTSRPCRSRLSAVALARTAQAATRRASQCPHRPWPPVTEALHPESNVSMALDIRRRSPRARPRGHVTGAGVSAGAVAQERSRRVRARLHSRVML